MENSNEKSEKEEKLAYQVDEFCRAVGIGRTSVYELIKENKLKTVMIAGRRVIPASEALRIVTEGA